MRTHRRVISALAAALVAALGVSAGAQSSILAVKKLNPLDKGNQAKEKASGIPKHDPARDRSNRERPKPPPVPSPKPPTKHDPSKDGPNRAKRGSALKSLREMDEKLKEDAP